MAYLTVAERYQIQAGLAINISISQIAINIGRHKSVVLRELQRNGTKHCKTGQWIYHASVAQACYAKRNQRKGKALKYKGTLKEAVEEDLKKHHSPEQIVGRRRLENKETVSAECIYTHIYEDKRQGGDLYQYLRRKRGKRRKRGNRKGNRGQIPNRISIEERPEHINTRQNIGDWEGDTIVGKNHQGAIVTLVERKSGYVLLQKSARDATSVSDGIVKAFSDCPIKHSSLTLDNGKEFSYHERFGACLNMRVYFAHPYSPWERGSNENTNGLIREYLPKRTDFTDLSAEDIITIQDDLNNRPRKKLGFLTPKEFLLEHNVAFDS
jgi:transposase, IS30 family